MMEKIIRKSDGKEGEGKEAFARGGALSGCGPDGVSVCGGEAGKDALAEDAGVCDGAAGRDALAEEMARQVAVLAELEEAEESEQVWRVLEVMAERVEDCEVEVLRIMNERTAGSSERLMDFVQGRVLAAVDGRLSVPHYVQRSKGEQEIYVYVGTHWVELDMQLYKDFVHRCCVRMGLPAIKVNSHRFMESLWQGVAFRLQGAWRRPRRRKDVWWMNLRNGTLEIDRLGRCRLREHRKEDYFASCLPYCYDEGARCEGWHRFLDRVLPDEGCQLLFQEFMVNAMVSGAVKVDKVLVLLGSGANGKSVALELMRALMGERNVSSLSLTDLTTNENARHAFVHKLLNISTESGRRIDPSVLKCVTSHEPMMVKYLYRDVYTTTDYGYLVGAFNELPYAEKSYAFYRRCEILPFNVTIEPEEADPMLAEKLKGELPGILNWLLEALPGLVKRGKLAACEVSSQEVEAYRSDTDPMYQFLQECCSTHTKTWTAGTLVYDRFKRFCWENNLQQCPALKTFYRKMKALKVKHETHGTGNQMHFNLKLL